MPCGSKWTKLVTRMESGRLPTSWSPSRTTFGIGPFLPVSKLGNTSSVMKLLLFILLVPTQVLNSIPVVARLKLLDLVPTSPTRRTWCPSQEPTLELTPVSRSTCTPLLTVTPSPDRPFGPVDQRLPRLRLPLVPPQPPRLALLGASRRVPPVSPRLRWPVRP